MISSLLPRVLAVFTAWGLVLGPSSGATTAQSFEGSPHYRIENHRLVAADEKTGTFDGEMAKKAAKAKALRAEDVVKEYRALFPRTDGKGAEWPSRFEADRGLVTGFPGEFKMRQLSAWTKTMAMQALAEGRKDIPVMVAATKDRTPEVQRLVSHAGGSILKSIPEIGYLHGVIPTAKIWWLLEQEYVTDVAIAGDNAFGPKAAGAPTVAESDPAVEAKLKEDRQKAKREAPAKVDKALPFLPASFLETKAGFNPNQYIQATSWLKEHPTWDGRGITIASVESPGDLSHPSLQEAKDLDGNVIPKVAAIVDAIDYENPNPADYFEGSSSDYSGEVLFSSDAKLSDGTVCPQPAGADEKVGVWKRNWYAYKFEYCASWNDREQSIRLDLNKNGSFTDETPIYDFNRKASYLKVPFEDKSGSKDEPHYITVYCLRDEKTGKILLPASSDNHSTGTATAAAGTGFMGTTIGGVAPAARLIFLNANHMNETIEGVWLEAKRPDVDLLTSSVGVSSFPTDTQPFFQTLLDRISEVTGKPILWAAGNHGVILEQGRGGRLIIGVGAYNHADTVQAFRASKERLALGEEDYVADFSDSGPSTNGNLGTDVIAPTFGVVGSLCGLWDEGRTSKKQIGQEYRLPQCWTQGGGTSDATPRAAGVVALLLSAAKQQRLTLTPAQVKSALIASARFLPNEPQFRQGAGLVQVDEAWKAILETAGFRNAAISSTTEALVPLYPQNWRGPFGGKSVYLTRGLHQGERIVANLTLHVSGISARDIAVDLLGNDGSYRVVSTKADSKNTRAKVTLEAVAKTPGNLSALLEVRTKGRSFPLARLPIFIAAAPERSQLSKGITLEGQYNSITQDFFLFDPPSKTPAIELRGNADTGSVNTQFVLGTNPTLMYDKSGIQSGMGLSTETRSAFLPLTRKDIVGLKFSGGDPKPSAFRVTVSAGDESLVETGTNMWFTTAGAPELAPVTVPDTPVERVEIAVPANTDAMVISLPANQGSATYDAFLYDPAGKRMGLWNYLPVASGGADFQVPKPKEGVWQLLLNGTFTNNPRATFLRQSAGAASTVTSYIPAGALCHAAECVSTWPFDNPLWRFLPLRAERDRTTRNR